MTQHASLDLASTLAVSSQQDASESFASLVGQARPHQHSEHCEYQQSERQDDERSMRHQCGEDNISEWRHDDPRPCPPQGCTGVVHLSIESLSNTIRVIETFGSQQRESANKIRLETNSPTPATRLGPVFAVGAGVQQSRLTTQFRIDQKGPR